MADKAKDKPKVTMPGEVQKVINSPDHSVPEKAEIAVHGADELYREIRIENKLTDEKGKKVRLKKGDPVDITVEAEAPEGTTPTRHEKG